MIILHTLHSMCTSTYVCTRVHALNLVFGMYIDECDWSVTIDMIPMLHEHARWSTRVMINVTDSITIYILSRWVAQKAILYNYYDFMFFLVDYAQVEMLLIYYGFIFSLDECSWSMMLAYLKPIFRGSWLDKGATWVVLASLLLESCLLLLIRGLWSYCRSCYNLACSYLLGAYGRIVAGTRVPYIHVIALDLSFTSRFPILHLWSLLSKFFYV